jgi:type IV pilus assembly protein PilM
MKKLFQKLLPKKNHFMGVDIGAYEIKAAEVKIIDGVPEVIALRRCPASPGVWTDELDEESLVLALEEIASPDLKEVITCIGGEKLVSRLTRLPRMSDRELETAARFEIEKFVPTPVDQLIIRYVRLDPEEEKERPTPKIKIFIPRTGETREISGNQEEGQNILLLAAPAATIYQYHSIFSRAGMVVTAIDLKAFALWRLFGRTEEECTAILDIGSKTSHLVLVKDGLIKFNRLLPAGGEILTGYISENLGVGPQEARQIKEEAAVTLDDQGDFSASRISRVLQEVLPEITRELERSLDYCVQENIAAKKLVLSGGTSKLTGLTGYLEDAFDLPVVIGIPSVEFSEPLTYDPAYAVAIGLALREACS